MQRAAVEQRRRRAHEIEAGNQIVELDGAGFAVDFVERQAHRDAHEEKLRQFDPAPGDVQEVAVVQRLQAEVAELQVALRLQRGSQARQVEAGQARIEQLGFDPWFYEFWQKFRGYRSYCAQRQGFAEHLAAQTGQQQAGR